MSKIFTIFLPSLIRILEVNILLASLQINLIYYYNVIMGSKEECTYTLRNDYLFKKLLGVDINKPILRDFLICAFGNDISTHAFMKL